MTELYFVRHCEPNFSNHDDLTRELTDKGKTDCALVTEFLKDKNIAHVISSPYKRAIDTVKPFADTMGLEVETEEDFRERRVDSCWIEDFNSFSKNQWEDFNYKLTDGECLGEVQQRNIRALYAVLGKYNNKNIAVGSHGTALSTVINYFLPSFGYEDFAKIKSLMPWIVIFRFEDEECISIESYDLFSNERRKLL